MYHRPCLSLDRDIFHIQRHGGIRLYFSYLNDSLLLNCSPELRLLAPSLPSRVFPLASRSRFDFLRRAWAFSALVASFVFPLLPFSRSRTVYHPTYYRNPLLRFSFNPVVVTIHDMIPECYPQYFNDSYRSTIKTYIRAKRWCLFAADAVIAVSHSTKADLLDVYPDINPDNVHVIHHGADHIPLKSSNDEDQPVPLGLDSGNFLLYVGSRNHYKGFYDLLDSFLEFSRYHCDFCLYCVGASFSSDESQRIKHLSLEGKVISVQADQSELIWLYRHAQALVYPSWREGFGLPILEAMRSYCPVLCSDIPSSREIASNHASFFKPGNPKDLLSKLIALLSQDAEMRRRRLSAALVHSSQFTWKQTAQRTCDLYLRVLNQRPA